MKNKKKFDLFVLKIKRAAMCLLGLTIFLFPGQNYYLAAFSFFQPASTRPLQFDLPSSAPYPVNFTGVKAPDLTAFSVVVLDQASAVPLFTKNEKIWLLPASTVKIMTALVALGHYHLDDVLTVGDLNVLGQNMDLVKSEKITVKNLIYGLLVFSANDAAFVLAQNYPGGQPAFIEAMNKKAKELSLNDTYFANPTGLDSDQRGYLLQDYSYTTALDLARLANVALKNPVFREIIGIQKITVSDVSGRIKHELFNINELLGKVEGLKGVKTGWTESAGECFVSFTERNGEGIIMVVLGSQDRFGETVKLLDWAFSNFRWENFTPSI